MLTFALEFIFATAIAVGLLFWWGVSTHPMHQQ
jgi:hypothetical protein